jgi:hypothetical protein
MPRKVANMSRLRTSVVAVVVVMLTASTAFAGDGAAAREIDRAGSNWMARKYLPDDDTRLGEVRVFRRDDALVVRTLLYSNLLKRIVAEIEIKAEEGWPQRSVYRDESRRYVAALARAREDVWSRWHGRGNRERGKHPQTLMIDFIVGPTRAAIEIGVPSLVVENGERSVRSVESSSDVSYSYDFVRTEALRILDDQFPERAAELAAALPAGTTAPTEGR